MKIGMIGLGAMGFPITKCLLKAGFEVYAFDVAEKALRDQLGLDENSRLLFISTEGATDRENYRAIVWDGKFESFGK